MSKKIFLVLMVLVFLRPHFNFLSSFLATYLADIMMLLLGGSYIIISRKKLSTEDSKLIILFIFLGVFLLLPLMVHSLETITDYKIWSNYGKLIYYCLMFWCFYQVLLKIPNEIKLFEKTMNYFFWIIFAVAMVQLTDFPILNKIVFEVYNTEKLRTIWTEYARIYSTFYNANWFGVYLVFYFGWLNSRFLYGMENTKKYIVYLIPLITMFIISGSRTAMIGLIVLLFIQILMAKDSRKVLKILVSGIIVFYLAQYIIDRFEYINKTIMRFTSTIETLLYDNFNLAKATPGRVESWAETWDLIKTNPAFGSGQIDFIPHNSYLYFLNMFGFFGGFVILSAVVIYFLVKKKKTYDNLILKQVNNWQMGFIFSFLVMSFSAEFFFTTQVILLVVIMFSIKYTLIRKEELVQKEAAAFE